MSRFHGAKIVRYGLALHLDAANKKSYPSSGTAWIDISGNVNTSTLTNGVSYSSTNKGAMVFDGIDDYVDCGPASFLGTSLTGLTVSLWFKPGANRTEIIVENGSSFSTNTFYMAQENANNLTFLVTNTSNAVQRVTGTASYTIGLWYNFVGVWNPGSIISAYVNGVNTSSGVLNPGNIFTSLRAGNTNLWLGRRPAGNLPHSGSISTVSMYSRALTAGEIRQNFEATRSRYGI
jgi:hypothetical protein